MIKGGYLSCGRTIPAVEAGSETGLFKEHVTGNLFITYLPAEGYQGAIPEFPLAFSNPFEDDTLGEAFRKRELEVWQQWWRAPQGAAWVSEPWRWNTVALAARQFVVCEMTFKAADKALLHRYLDDIGLTAAGLRTNDWRILPQEEINKLRNGATQEELPLEPTPLRERRLRSA